MISKCVRFAHRRLRLTVHFVHRRLRLTVCILAIIIPMLLLKTAYAGTDATQIRIEVKTGVELVLALASLTERGQDYNNYSLMAQEVRERFADFKEHPAVLETQKLMNSGFGEDALVMLALCHSGPPEFKQIAPYLSGAEFLDRLSVCQKEEREKYLKRYMEKIRDFYETSHFGAFLAEHDRDYQQVRQIAENVLSEKLKDGFAVRDVPQALEDFYREKKASYTLVPSMFGPADHGSGFGPRVEIDGQVHAYVVFQNFPTARIPILDNMHLLALHEFSHSFVNPITLKFLATAQREQIETIKQIFESSISDTWVVSLLEHTVDAIAARICLNLFGEEVANKVLTMRQPHEIYIRHFYNKLADYEANRDKYPTFASFYPELVSVENLEAIEESAKIQEQMRK